VALNSLIVPAPAKLNLFLHVTGRRADGYHELESLFVALDYGDTVTLSRRDDGAVVRVADLAGIPVEADLAVRAARALQRETACPFGADIAVVKRIPQGGGLGGEARRRFGAARPQSPVELHLRAALMRIGLARCGRPLPVRRAGPRARRVSGSPR
jgi:4-diphosphocytidyl-2-C-methyl-D-erythritol kinase